MAVIRKKTTVYVDSDLLRAVKVLAASTGRQDYEIIEDALRHYLSAPPDQTSRNALRGLLGELGGQPRVGEDEALRLAYAELRAARRAPRG